MISTHSTMSWKPKKATTGLRGFFNRRRDKYDSIIEIRLATSSSPLPYPNGIEAVDDDTSSISSHSTNSTVDDNPGTGRLIDKHIYQKFGRKLEHLIFRIKLPSPSPDCIYGFFEKIYSCPQDIHHAMDYSMEKCVHNLMKSEHGNSIIYGLKCLVKQTQSSSLHQSAAAIIALMQVTMFDNDITDLYVHISRYEPIFRTETLVISNNDSSLIKNYTLLLVKLEKAHNSATKIDSYCLPQFLREYFLRLLEALPRIPVADDLFAPVAEACRIYASALADIGIRTSSHLGPGVEVFAAETIYFIIIFFLRSIPILWAQISTVKDQKTQQFIGMVLSALSNWIDCSFGTVISATTCISNPDNKLMEIRIAFHGLLHIHPYVRVILPRSFNAMSTQFVPHLILPKRIRGSCQINCCRACCCTTVNPPLVQALLDQSKSRLIRLHASFTELEREARDRTPHDFMMMQRAGPGKDRFLEGTYKWKLEHNRTFSKAVQARVIEDESTEEFRLARKQSNDFHQYKISCLWRSRWAKFFLSNLDWDWDLAGSLEQLYALDESTPIPPAHAQHPETHIATIDAEGAVGRIWDMKTRTTQQRADLPEKVRISYASEAGDIKYMVFARDAEVPGDSTEGRTSLSDYDDDAEERRSDGTAEVDMCTGGSGSSGTQCFIGEITGVEGNDATTSPETPSDSESSLDYQECDSVSWSAQDIDGRPVLPCVEEESECEAFVEELASESEGEGTTFGMSAKSTQVPPKGNDPPTSFAQYISFATEAPDNQAFIEELDDEKDGDVGTTTSKVSNELVKASSSEIDSASAFTGQA